MSLPSADLVIFAAILLIGFPVADYLVVRKLKRSRRPTKSFYAWTLVSEWLLTLAAIQLLRRHGLALSDVGEGLGRYALTIGFIVAGLLLIGVTAAYNHKRFAQLSPQKLSKVMDSLGCLVPTTKGERAWFVIVAITAGFCEELLYRGWLWWFLEHLTAHLWLAVVLSAVAFGFGHAYQGRTAIVTTAIAALVFSLPVLLAKSLIPGQVIHAGLDLMNGVLLSKALESSLRTRAPQSAC